MPNYKERGWDLGVGIGDPSKQYSTPYEYFDKSNKDPLGVGGYSLSGSSGKAPSSAAENATLGANAATAVIQSGGAIFQDIVKRRAEAREQERKNREGVNRAHLARDEGTARIRDQGSQRGFGMLMRGQPSPFRR